MANYTSVTASNICDAAGNKLASGTVSFQATDAANQPLNFQVGGGGQVVTTPATAAITAGAVAGGFQVADSANTSPAGILYRITITDTTLNRVVVTYSLVTVTGTTFSLDNFSQTGAAVLPPVGGSVNGPLSVNGNLSVTGAFSVGSLAPFTTPGVNNYIFVDGATYPLTPAGIQAALNQASANGGGTVILPPTRGTPIAMGSTAISIPVGVSLWGAGMTQTELHWTSAPTGGGLTLASPVGQSVRDLKLSFASHLNAVGIRITATLANPAWYNTFESILIDFGVLGANGSTGIYASGDGIQTEVVLNHFRNIGVNTAETTVHATDCEGNWWQVYGQNLGTQIGSIMAKWDGNNNNEHLDLRMETGSGNFTNEVGLQLSGQDNIVRLTCDAALSFVTAVNDLGDYNIFDITGIGSPTLGTIGPHSQYRWTAESIADSRMSPLHSVVGGGSGVAPTFSGTSIAAYGDVLAPGGSGSAKVYGAVGAARVNSDASGDRAYGGWFKATAQNNVTSEVGIHAEVADGGGMCAEFAQGGAIKATIDGTGKSTFKGLIADNTAAPTVAAGQVGIGSTHATTVGAAGGATALPATPLGYLIANVDGTQVKIPYYNN